jgi:hypothetical protein
MSGKRSQAGRFQIGAVGVDSGQLIVADPCYIDSEWTRTDKDESPVPIVIYRDRETKRTYACDACGRPSDVKADVWFRNWQAPLADYGGRTAEKVRPENWVEEQAGVDRQGEFNYRGVCHTTLKGEHGSGQLKYKLGHDGVGVACGGFGGDGVYPVYVETDSSGTVKRLIVEFQEE